jgi:uncharacterized protein (DUF697 family)
MPAGVSLRDAVGVLREARRAAAAPGSLLVTGILAAELARELRAGSSEPHAVRLSGPPTDALALLVVLAGEPGRDEDGAMREATRAAVPLVAVQTDTRAPVALPYVLATDVVLCPPGRGFPVDEIAHALARAAGHDAVALAARLPALRDGVARELIRVAALRAGLIGALPWFKGAHFPALTLVQSRLVLDLAAAYGQELDAARAPELGAVAGVGLGLRSLARRVLRGLPLLGALPGYLGTRAIGEAAMRRYAASAPEEKAT